MKTEHLVLGGGLAVLAYLAFVKPKPAPTFQDNPLEWIQGNLGTIGSNLGLTFNPPGSPGGPILRPAVEPYYSFGGDGGTQGDAMVTTFSPSIVPTNFSNLAISAPDPLTSLADPWASSNTLATGAALDGGTPPGGPSYSPSSSNNTSATGDAYIGSLSGMVDPRSWPVVATTENGTTFRRHGGRGITAKFSPTGQYLGMYQDDGSDYVLGINESLPYDLTTYNAGGPINEGAQTPTLTSINPPQLPVINFRRNLPADTYINEPPPAGASLPITWLGAANLPFTYFRTSPGGLRYLVSALHGQDIAIVYDNEWETLPQ